MDSAQRPQVGRGANRRNGSLGKRQTRLLALSLLLALALAGAFSVSTLGGAGLASAAIQKARSLVELLNRRSPGRRTEAHLVKIKHKWAKPHERALPKVAVDLPFPTFAYQPALIDIVSAPPLTVPAGLEKSALPPIAEAPPPGSGPPIILPPGEGTPVGPPVVSQPPLPPPPPPPPPLPEPASWLTMLLGFGLLGCLLRKAPRPASA
ncbi:MAG TPA: PEP-CTERM sorting domain-containing protein [Sphingomicrobium sp.]|nr:PEP-CTERM sorting domain-containing protein [Sphingomicrobium sp.]